jgi:predicted AlkP superfamily phosphohydrolase/phosphomutase
MLVIGLDAADPTLIEKWCDAGILPTLSRLRNNGAWVKLTHNGEFPSASIWPTISTGTHPGRHGIYHTVPIMLGNACFGQFEPEQCSQAPFWCDLDRYGKQCVLLDFPFSYPRPDLNALQICDWGSYERFAPPRSVPRKLLPEIIARFGRYPVGDKISRDVPLTARDLRRTRRQLLAGIAHKGKVIRWLTAHRPWDLFAAVFGEPHAAGHYFWKFQASVSSQVPGEFAATIQDVYRAADRELAKIVETLDDRTILLVLSGQGMGPNHVGWHLIPQLLSNSGLNGESQANGDRFKADWLAKLRNLVPAESRRALSRYLPNRFRDSLRLHWAASKIAWSHTQVFDLPTDSLGFLRVNLKGREPNGIVEPGGEYDELCQRTRKVLQQLVLPNTGQKVVRRIFFTDEIFPGTERDRLPDMIVDWNDGTEINAAYSRQAGTVAGRLPDPRQGNHRPEGFAIVYCSTVKRGYVSEGHILDIAPTILHWFGLEPAGWMDGRPWTELLHFRSGTQRPTVAAGK